MLFTKVITIFSLLAGTNIASCAPLLEKRATARTSPPAGSIVVRQTGAHAGEYSTLSAAVASLGSNTTAKTIFIYPGIYTEQVYLGYKGSLTIYGSTVDISNYKNNQVTIQYGLNSASTGTLDSSATLQAHTNNFKLYNVNVYNTYGEGAPALALSAYGNQQGYYGCSFKGFQDTLMANANLQYYSNCYIEGATDYIFGKASAWFGKCTIASSAGGAITANSRDDTADRSWFVIDSSTITATPSSSFIGKIFLGRPWRTLSRVIYQNSILTNVVEPAGWTTMVANATPIYEEWNNSGAGNGSSKQRLYETAAKGPVSKETLFGENWKTWIDDTY